VGSLSVAATAISLVGTSYRRADLALRERVHLTPQAAADLSADLASDGREAVVVATCNRTEIYIAGDAAPARAALAGRLASGRENDVLDEREGRDAVLHIFRVAAGLESQLPGESQVLGQVREAYELARGRGATGPALSRLFEHALRTGKRVRAETGVGTTPAAVPAAAADLARRVVGDLEGRRVVVIGAGKMGELAVTSFLARGAERVFVANHRLERAEELARRFGGEAVPFDRMAEELTRADVVLSSTRCPQTILHADEIAPAIAARAGRPLVLLDIAVPRDLDPAIADLPGCVLFDLDALGSAGLELGDEATASAEAIVAEEADAFDVWLAAREAAPTVAALRRRAEEIRLRELARAEPRLRDLSPAERERVERLTAQIVAKLLHEPTVRAQESAGEHAAALRHLFALADGPA
jgi:glutamyl-tRNA reductase